jgi:hypothetical protein
LPKVKVSYRKLRLVTEENRCVHVNECGHRENSRRQCGMEDLADGVVEHVRRVQPGVGGLDLGRVVALVVGLKQRFRKLK